jgi:XTP/dITP diphosphohydrolase
MRIVLATSNSGKVKEIERFFRGWEPVPYTDLIDKFEIEESGKTFQENAVIKAKAVWEKLKASGMSEVVISDDSGISVEALDWEPNIYSARYAGVGASSRENLEKLISKLEELNLEESTAFYTASIAIVDREGNLSTTHGWMYGKVSPKIIGDGGFGYDPIFTPHGESETLGTLPIEVKERYSHRIKALKLAKIILNKLEK